MRLRCSRAQIPLVATSLVFVLFYTAAAISVVALGVLAAARNPHAEPMPVPARMARV